MNRISHSLAHRHASTSLPLMARSAAAPLLFAVATVASAGGQAERERMHGFYNWTPQVTAANCPPGKRWAVPSNGGVAFCENIVTPAGADSFAGGFGGGGDGGDSFGFDGGFGGDGFGAEDASDAGTCGRSDIGGGSSSGLDCDVSDYGGGDFGDTW